MTVYYEKDGITIYNGDARDLKGALIYDVVITDPPYGISHPTNYKSRGRDKLAACSDYPPVLGDTEPFDPTLWLDRPACLWGANYFADKLPPVSGWLVWNKKRPPTLDQATCELAWTNFVKGVRIFDFLWNGCMRAERETYFHPTQKPVALSRWILSLKWTPPGVVLDPYMGAGGMLLACKESGRKAIGIELSEQYCEIAAKRLEAVPPRAASPLEG